MSLWLGCRAWKENGPRNRCRIRFRHRYRTTASASAVEFGVGQRSRHPPRLLDPVRATRTRSGVRAAWRGLRGPAGTQEATVPDVFDPSAQLDHERLDAYAAAVALDGAGVAIVRKAGHGHDWLGDQAVRASASVVLNFITHILCVTPWAVAARRWPSAPASGSPKRSGVKGWTGLGHFGSPAALCWGWTRP